MRVPRFIAERLSFETKTALTEGVRQSTSAYRCLPDFLIVGAQKSGTTALHRYLRQHPQVHVSFRKEVDFFSTNYDKGTRWYRGNFPLRSTLRYRGTRTERKITVGEASPYYLFHPHAPRRIAETLPGVKLIALLRNPTDRAISHYHHNARREAREPLTLQEALAEEDERLDGEREKMLENPKRHSYDLKHYSYKARGEYAPQVAAYLDHFGRDQLLFLRSERFFAETARTLHRVCQFLDINPSYSFQQTSPQNTGGYSDDHAQARADLDAYFRAPNQDLLDLLGQDFDWA